MRKNNIITFQVSEKKTGMETKHHANGDSEYIFFMTHKKLNEILEKHFDAKNKVSKLKKMTI